MSSVNRIHSQPASVVFSPPTAEKETAPQLLRRSGQPSNKAHTKLIVKGQGVLFGGLKDNLSPFSFVIHHQAAKGHENGFKLHITAAQTAASGTNNPAKPNPSRAEFFMLVDNTWQNIYDEKTQKPLPGFELFIQDDSGLDADVNCRYWLSVDSHNRQLRYGKGEVRLSTLLAQLKFPPAPENPNTPDPFAWVKEVAEIFYSQDNKPKTEDKSAKPKNSFYPLKLFRDPVTTDPALYVLPTDAVTMDDMAYNRATVAANLTETCQKLYNNVAGAKFQLNTPDFPHFTDAIEASIASPQGWCYKILKQKADEFGQPNPNMTYLRITMGVNQGDSPGVPFVMEIWPPGHYSPVHNHAGANAVIRVLHGEITVNLYPMLSKYHLQPFGVAKFGTGDVTWISPDLNQTHQLRNTNVSGPTCITIQCYMYGEGNTEHYSYFDYLNSEGQTEQFDPNSDCDYLTFKELMRYEWINGLNPKK